MATSRASATRWRRPPRSSRSARASTSSRTSAAPTTSTTPIRWRNFEGTHGLGHVRLATESDVAPEASHPFWATGFADVAIVHNGQITNYCKLRRRLEKRGNKFNTDNDCELIAVYLADKLEQGSTLTEALESSIARYRRHFSFLVSTKDEIGYAKDRLAAKPMVKYEDDDLVAIASEEVSLNRLFPGTALETSEPAAGDIPHVASIDLAESRSPTPIACCSAIRRRRRGRRRHQPGRPPPYRRRAHASDHAARPRLGRLLLRRPDRRAATSRSTATSAGASPTTCTRAPSSCAATPAPSPAWRSAAPRSSCTATSARAPDR